MLEGFSQKFLLENSIRIKQYNLILKTVANEHNQRMQYHGKRIKLGTRLCLSIIKLYLGNEIFR